MSPPTDVKGVKRCLGMVNYLAKFLPLLLDMTQVTQLLRQLEDKDVEWCWLEQHEKAFNSKGLPCESPSTCLFRRH
jgi:hypothetical protein